jgi:calcineurin-like phosphoesterase family protein
MELEKKCMYILEKDYDETHKVFELLDQNNDNPFYLYHNPKDTNNKLRGQFTAFYMRMKNKTSTIKNFERGIIRDIPI